MTGGLGANSEEFRAVQRLVSGIADEMAEEFGKLAARGDALVDGWQGVTGPKYGEDWERWKSGFAAVHKALEDETRLLGESADEYDKTEGESAQSLAKVEPGFNW